MKSMKKVKIWSVLILAIWVLGSCSNGNNKTIRMAYVNWAEGVAMTNVVKQVLEDRGYTVKMMNADVAPIFASLAQGKADAFMDTWVPVTHKDYLDKYGDRLEDLGANIDDSKIGLVVPDYVTVNSIDELNEYADKFGGKIVGIDAGAGIMRQTEKAIPDYGLNFKLETASESAMTASLKKAVDKGDWIVVTGWTPHWMFSRWDLKMLKDPKGIYGEAETIKTMARKGLSEDHPFVAQFLKNIHFTQEQIGSLMQAVEEGSNVDAAVKKWIDENQDLVNSWIPKDDQ